MVAIALAPRACAWIPAGRATRRALLPVLFAVFAVLAATVVSVSAATSSVRAQARAAANSDVVGADAPATTSTETSEPIPNLASHKELPLEVAAFVLALREMSGIGGTQFQLPGLPPLDAVLSHPLLVTEHTHPLEGASELHSQIMRGQALSQQVCVRPRSLALFDFDLMVRFLPFLSSSFTLLLFCLLFFSLCSDDPPISSAKSRL